MLLIYLFCKLFIILYVKVTQFLTVLGPDIHIIAVY